MISRHATTQMVLLLALTLSACQTLDSSKHGQSGEAGSHKSNETADINTVKVQSLQLRKEVRIPAELIAFRSVPIYPKAQGFIKSISVDRGSVVQRGQLLIQIDAPELEAQYGEAEAKLEAASSAYAEMQAKIARSLADQKEAEARLAKDEAVQRRIQHAAKTPGAIAETDLDEAEHIVQADRAHVLALKQAVEAARSQLLVERSKEKAAKQALSSIRQLKSYLNVTAPFDGVITERNVHEGALVSSSSLSKPMLRIEQTSVLRLIVPVPEKAISGIKLGMSMSFTVPSHTGKVFSAIVKRIGHSLDVKSRSMPVEADVDNARGELEPGMYPEVVWQLERPYKTLFVPSAAVVTSTDSTFVIRVKDGIANRIEVSKGQTMGDYVEVSGDLQPGDEIAQKGNEELKDGIKVNAHHVAEPGGKEFLSVK